MAIPTLRQSLPGNSASTNPSLAFASNLQAGSLLVVAVVQQGQNYPGVTDTLLNTWQIALADQQGGPSGHTCALYYAYGASAGADTVQFQTDHPAAYAIHEFRNVAATQPTGLIAIDGIALDAVTGPDAVGTSITVPYSLTQTSELIVCTLLSPANTTFTTPAGVTVAQTVQSGNGSVKTVWGTAPSVSTGSIVTSQPTTQVYCAFFATFFHS